MKKKNIYLLFLSIYSLLTTLQLHADHVLLMYLKTPPENIVRSVEKEINQDEVISTVDTYLSDQTPAKITQKIAQGALRNKTALKPSGFLALYSGDYTFSNADGLIYFPHYHTSKKAYLVITPKINLEKIKGETIAHPQLAHDASASSTDSLPAMTIPQEQPQKMCKIYVYEKKESTHKNGPKYSYWEVREQPLPADRKINPLAIVLLTNPANVYVETKDYLSSEQRHLQLPSPYIVGAVDNEKAILEALEITHYFKPVSVKNKKSGDLKSQTIYQDN